MPPGRKGNFVWRAANALEKEGSRPEYPKTKVAVPGCTLASASTSNLDSIDELPLSSVSSRMPPAKREERQFFRCVPQMRWKRREVGPSALKLK